jgi:hypothetical protein
MNNGHNYKNLEALIECKTIFEGSKVGGKKKLFSTNVFIPEDINKIDIKTYNYLTGFIKLVETFEKRTDGTWFLLIYIDDMFINDKTYNSINTSSQNTNTFYNKKIKNTFNISKNNNNTTKNLKKTLNELLNLYKKYIKHITDNKNDYKCIKLISYKCGGLNQNKYLGHTSTFGSIVRFLPIFEDNEYEYIVTINISHAISIFFFCEIQKWIASNSIIMTIAQLYSGEQTNLFAFLTEFKILTKDIMGVYLDKYRIPAGLFGIKKTEHYYGLYSSDFTKKISNLIKLFNLYINEKLENYNNKHEEYSGPEIHMNPFSYGIDELIITDIFYDILKDKTDKKNIYLLGDTFINPIFKNPIFKNPNFNKFKIKYYVTNPEPTSLVLNIEGEIIKNINKTYKDYLTDKDLNLLKDYHRFININNFINNKDIIQSFISPYSNIFYTLLNSLDETNPLLIIPINKLSKYTDKLQIITNNSINLEHIITYYKTLPDLNINIGSKSINTTNWDNTYCNILETERIDIHQPYRDIITTYYDTLISDWKTKDSYGFAKYQNRLKTQQQLETHPQPQQQPHQPSPLSTGGYKNINKHNKLTKKYKIYKKLTKYKHKKIIKHN